MLKTATLISFVSIFSLMTFLILVLPNNLSSASAASISAEQYAASLDLGSFESGLNSANGSYWLRSEDRIAGGESLAEVSYHSEQQNLHVQAAVNKGFQYPWAGAALFSKKVIDATQYSSISFDVQGTPGSYLIMAFSGSMGEIPPMQSFSVDQEWQTINLPLSKFKEFDASNFKGLAIVAGPTLGSFEYYLDNVKLQ